MSDTDFASCAVLVATRFWGDANKALSTSKKIVWGSNGGRSVSVEKGTWFDYETDEGGGVIALVMRENSCDKPAAIKWLQQERFIEIREQQQSPADSRDRREAPPVDDPPFEPDQPPAEPEGKKVMVKGYDYTDADGGPLYQVVRFQWKLPDGSWVIDPKTGNPKKTFAQRRKDAAGREVWNLDGIGHTIYRHQKIEQAIEAGTTVFLNEGEKDAETLEEWGLVATTNSGGAKHWSPAMAETLRGADVVIMVDNDDAGRDGAELKAKSLRSIAARVRMCDLAQHIPDFPAKLDVTDWRDRLAGNVEQLLTIVDSLPNWKPRPPVSKFGAVGLHELHRKDLQHEWWVDDFLDRQGVIMMPGGSGAGKTFLLLDILGCTALGQSFWGMKTLPGLVIYQAGEGKQGVSKRIDGWLQDRGVIEDRESIPFKVLTRRINLFVDDKDTDDLIAECKLWIEYFDLPLRALVIDTFNKAITGANENAGQDMTKVLARLERMSVELNCAVIVPIHKSAEGKMRGHTSLTGDVANVLNVTELQIRDQNGRVIRTAQLDKNKDGDKGPPHRFVLRQVVVGMREDRKPITTCVVDRPNGDEAELVAEGKLSLNQTLFLQTLRDSIDIEGEDAPSAVAGVPKGKKVVKYKAFENRLWNKWPFMAPEHEIEKRKKEFERAVGDAGKRLVAFGYVERDNATKLIWWTGKSDRPARKPKPIDPPGTGMAPDVKREIKDMEVPF